MCHKQNLLLYLLYQTRFFAKSTKKKALSGGSEEGMIVRCYCCRVLELCLATFDLVTRFSLLLLLLLILHRLRAGTLGKIAYVVVQQADVDASTMDAGRRAAIFRSNHGVSHTNGVNAIDRNVMFDYQIAHHGLGHCLRVV